MKIKLFTLLSVILCILTANVFASSNDKSIIDNSTSESSTEDLNLPSLSDFSDIDEEEFVPGEYYDFNLTHEENVINYRNIRND